MKEITRFRFKPGDDIADKYEVIRLLGAGWEGEVYLVNERRTGIARTAKLFFPKRNPAIVRLRPMPAGYIIFVSARS